MRFLFTIQPALAHLHPIVPIARALVESEQDVQFAAGARVCRVIENLGIPSYPAGIDWIGEDMAEVFPERDSLPLEKHVEFDVGEVFARRTPPPMIDDILEHSESWKPDLIVRDLWEFGGCIAAEVMDIPHAVIGLSGAAIAPQELFDPLIAEPLTELRGRYNLPPDSHNAMLYRYLRLDLIPSSYRPPALKPPSVTHTIRPVTEDRTMATSLPEWIGGLPFEETVLVTLGTVNNQHPEIFRAILTGLASERVNVIATIGTTLEPEMFGPQPEQIRIEKYVPYSLLLDHIDAVVMHGGFTSTMTALNKGLPIVFIPLALDHPVNAERFTELGAGITLSRSELTPEVVRNAVLAVLQEPMYRNAAQRIQQEMIAQPGPEYAAELLIKLAKDKQPILSEFKQ